MKAHEVEIIKIPEEMIYKGVELSYEIDVTHCKKTDEYWEEEDQIRSNWQEMRKAHYRKLAAGFEIGEVGR
jgi:hypothetical protein